MSTQLEKYKKNERILDRMNRRWQAAFDIIADAVAILDADQRIIRCNLAMQSLIGRPLGKIVGHACWQLVHGTDQPPKQCPYAAVRTSHKQATFRLAMGHRWFDITVDPCLDDQDRIAGYIHI
ncbi:MAG: PAS domain-containing protein, partial [Desulfatitalea sp.]|nr:PAS domain-containing protein [Desulfatitalea sp.]